MARAGEGEVSLSPGGQRCNSYVNSDLDLTRKRLAEIPMLNPTQPDVLDRMIARLEEANARSYNDQSRVDEPSKLDHDDHHQLPSQPAAPIRRLRWARLWLAGVFLMIVTASVYVTIFASASSYVDTVKVRIARWANRSASQMTLQGGASPIPQISLEMEPRLQRMTGELAELQQQIEQLKASQSLASRNSAETVAQFKIDREQMMRDSANVADQLRATRDQLRATQTQLAEILSAEANNSDRKFFRRRRVSTLAQRARARRSAR